MASTEELLPLPSVLGQHLNTDKLSQGAFGLAGSDVRTALVGHQLKSAMYLANGQAILSTSRTSILGFNSTHIGFPCPVY